MERSVDSPSPRLAVHAGYAQELEHERILRHISGHLDFVSAPSEREDLLLVAALREPLEEERRELPLELAAGEQLTAERVLVERAVEDGMFAARAGAVAELTDVTLRDTLATTDELPVPDVGL